MSIVCAVCGKPLTRYNCVRIGGLIEHITGKRFMCRDCAERAKNGDIKMVVR